MSWGSLGLGQWMAAIVLDVQSLVSASNAREAVLATAYLVILGAVVYLLKRRRYMVRPARLLAILFVVFGSSGLIAHAVAALGFGSQLPALEPTVQLMADGAVLAAALVVWPAVYMIARQPAPAELEREVAAQLRKLEELRGVRSQLEKQVAARTAQLQETTQRFEVVLRQSPVSVFSQDAELRYSWIRNAPPAYPADWRGKTDLDLLLPEPAALMTEIKRRVMESGDARRTEVVLGTGNEQRWYDLTVEPLRAVDGSIVGITSAAVDITHRKQSEQLLEMLLREVTHRSKNLLAVCQAIVRNTSPRTASGRAYSAQLGARLQALAVSHDLLVEENWRGVPLAKLVRAQLGKYADRIDKQISLEGPEIRLRPNGVDSIGLVVHELADNAAKYGALSTNAGRVSVRWFMTGTGADSCVQFEWQESGGPPVVPPADTGFGRALLEQALGVSLSGEVKLDFMPGGVRCQITLPAFHLLRTDDGAQSTDGEARA
ncbi:MAG TPA: HWE histidine kinase domain-containing protein [Hyphomicrobiaceae bacterium]|nr:HWE histidine kinase domain-containing protein [Hyphomicrobiaceae bacterium]